MAGWQILVSEATLPAAVRSCELPSQSATKYQKWDTASPLPAVYHKGSVAIIQVTKSRLVLPSKKPDYEEMKVQSIPLRVQIREGWGTFTVMHSQMW